MAVIVFSGWTRSQVRVYWYAKVAHTNTHELGFLAKD